MKSSETTQTDRYKIRESINDVVAILDSVPMGSDLFDVRNIIQLTNRAPIVHLAIERAIKALITNKGHKPKSTHDLKRLYETLCTHDLDAATKLESAFQDAVEYYRFDTEPEWTNNVESIGDYFSKTGDGAAFNVLRYWAIGETSRGEGPIPLISLHVHREILCALEGLYSLGDAEGVSARVNISIEQALYEGWRAAYATVDFDENYSINWLSSWLRSEFKTKRRALQVAVQRNFSFPDGDFQGEALRVAYQTLERSRDPAIAYCLRTLHDLSEKPQCDEFNVTPIIEWDDGAKRRGTIVTPTGQLLAFIDKLTGGRWSIMPLGSGSNGQSRIGESLVAVEQYVIELLTRRVTVATGEETSQLRLVNDSDFFVTAAGREVDWVDDLDRRATEYNLEFWDGQHGLNVGNSISVTLHPNENGQWTSVIQGEVKSVTDQSVTIVGSETMVSTKDE